MNHKAIQNIAQQLRGISNNAMSIQESEFKSFRMHDGVAYSLTDEDSILYNEIVGKILKHKDFIQKFSSKYIDKKLKYIFSKLLSKESFDLEKELESLFRELSEFEQNCSVLLRIEGVYLSICFELGRVKFVPGDENLISAMQTKAETIIALSKENQLGRNSIQQFFNQQVQAEIGGACVGIVEVNAEPDRAFEVAKEEVRRAIDLLRLSSKAIYPLKEDMKIGLKGENTRSNRQGFVFSDSGVNTKGDSIGSVLPFEINQKALERMDDIGIFSISEALNKQQATNFEESLIRSIHWFSVALTQDENCNSFLFLIVALESLFKAERGNSIGGVVAESVAMLMSDTLEGRKKLVSLVREYYGKRSGVAHGGKKTISDIELHTLISISGTSIMMAIKKIPDFTSQKQFMEWFENQKLEPVKNL